MIFQIPHVGFSKDSLALGPLDVLLHKLHHLFELFILLGVGLHPLEKLAALFGSPSYALQKQQDYEDLHSPTT